MAFSTTVWADWETLSIPANSDFERIIDLTFIDQMHGWALVTNTFSSRVVRTSNGGQTWDALYSTEYDGDERSMLQFVTSTVGYYAPNDPFDSEILLRSTDGGMTFNPVTVPFDGEFFDGDVASVFFLDDMNGWAAGEFSAGMFSKTTNGGTSWEVHAAQRNFNANDLFFTNPMHGWAVGGDSLSTDGLIAYTQNGGGLWQIGRTQTQSKLLAVRFTNDQTGWAVGENGNIHVSINGGRTWYPQSSGTTANLTDLEPIDENIVIATGKNFSPPGVVLLTTNGGGFWRRQGLPLPIHAQSIARIDHTVWVGGQTYSATPGSIFLFRQTIDPANLPGIVFDQLPGGTTGIPYEFPLAAVNGSPPYSWSLVGNGNGLSVNPQTGLISGTPVQAGDTDFLVKLSDSNQNKDERTIRINVIDTPLALASSVIPAVTHRTTFRFPLDLEGGHKPYHFRLLGNNPPPGVSVDQQGVLSGTPFETGNFNFTIEAVDSGSLPQKVTADFSLQVNSLLQEHWDIQHAHNRITGVHFFNQNRGLAIGWSGLLLETDNGGRSWKRRPLGGDELIGMDWVGDQGWIFVNGGRILHSTNQGVSWEETAPVGISSAWGIKFFDAQHGYAFGSGIYYTEDGGQSWHQAVTPAGHYYFGLAFRDQLNGFAGGDGAVFDNTTDGGKNWIAGTLPGFSKGNQAQHNQAKGDFPTIGRASRMDGKGTQSHQIQGVYFVNSQEG
jgi:photosystem II stability/assembly factor-like uncharacterized protein